MYPRPTTASKRAGVRPPKRYSSCLEHAKDLLLANGIAVDEVYAVESPGFSDSGLEEILFVDVTKALRTAILAGNMDKADGALDVIDGWS